MPHYRAMRRACRFFIPPVDLLVDNNTILLHYIQYGENAMFVEFRSIAGVKIDPPFERELKILMSPDKDDAIKGFTLLLSTLAPHGGCTKKIMCSMPEMSSRHPMRNWWSASSGLPMNWEETSPRRLKRGNFLELENDYENSGNK